ncbi:tetrahydromethanopterin S-methyltransferase subunit A [Methanococcus maripaludis]|uniref:Tetrahydromethanopterin S-methyltransferase subunit A n=3 Tax=Methanococcus maripaludis TaxID=39152 RepID=A0A2L1CBF1_METMI|nr:tetrahydromethanopterin S-methyltransferase subunit A [Methanococcus maripaludis]AEK20587.1 tetrahydromethanopterin S-methyltransferase subunit A [Methanococcus maripaludis X1]AVB76653.1 tetrahydromethanopterin S-methyltransferase subunit A [Methanococcus maripaludis]MBB6496833.1 tetrahydromethanopterin S-methyltransferase subunit A [Methanococcus maripaludis]MBG0769162.1 tetrahydromethanopterin S-methyltransferase subunit A [Methanococcus maripaludis]MBM7409607.1 tetrahydromethanopterin S-
MADKKAPAAGWPVANGEYVVGNPESCVAVVTLGSHGLDQAAIDAGAAISGPCHTENLGIEKVVANYISNPNIRFMVITGSEVQGHITGQCIKALYENGIGDDGGIIGAKGAIPFMENVGTEPVGRLQSQIVECIDLIDVEDTGKISDAIKNCISKDPGAFEEDPMVIELEGGAAAAGEESTSIKPTSPEMALLEARMRIVSEKMNEAAMIAKFNSGYYNGKIQGIAIGLFLSIVIFSLL